MKQKLGRFLLAIFAAASISAMLPTQRLMDDDEDLTVQCPVSCRSIEYESFWWYVECYGLPRRCSANPTTAAHVSAPLMTRLRMR